jgi:hypothetical protein
MAPSDDRRGAAGSPRRARILGLIPAEDIPLPGFEGPTLTDLKSTPAAPGCASTREGDGPPGISSRLQPTKPVVDAVEGHAVPAATAATAASTDPVDHPRL